MWKRREKKVKQKVKRDKKDGGKSKKRIKMKTIDRNSRKSKSGHCQFYK